MAFKDVLVYADAGPAAAQRYDLAAKLARDHGGHLAALHVWTPPLMVVDPIGGVPGTLIELHERVQGEQAAKTRALVEAAERRSGVAIEYREVRGELAASAALHARYADVIVVSQAALEGEQVVEADMLPEEMVFLAGRPVLVVPRHGRFERLGERVLIAWDRSREATRAIHDALPMLVRASSVTVMEVETRVARRGHIAGADLARHLARHDVKAEVSSTTSADIDVADIILSRSVDLGADLLVMGAYGHSRLRELVLGGVTRQILAQMTLPVLMSH